MTEDSQSAETDGADESREAENMSGRHTASGDTDRGQTAQCVENPATFGCAASNSPTTSPAENVRYRAEHAGVIMGPVCVGGGSPRQCDNSASGDLCDVCGADTSTCDHLIPAHPNRPGVMTTCPKPPVWTHPNGVLRYCEEHADGR
jgi:hypothetical protein